MKTKNNLIKIVLSVMVIVFMLISCEKDDESAEINTTNQSIKLKIDNNKEILFKDDLSAMILGDKLVIGATDKTSNSDIQIILEPNIEPGTYSTGFAISHGVDGNSIFTTITNTTSVNLTIQTHSTSNKHITGTFSLDFIDNNTQEQHHANGSFDINYL